MSEYFYFLVFFDDAQRKAFSSASRVLDSNTDESWVCVCGVRLQIIKRRNIKSNSPINYHSWASAYGPSGAPLHTRINLLSAMEATVRVYISIWSSDKFSMFSTWDHDAIYHFYSKQHETKSNFEWNVRRYFRRKVHPISHQWSIYAYQRPHCSSTKSLRRMWWGKSATSMLKLVNYFFPHPKWTVRRAQKRTLISSLSMW